MDFFLVLKLNDYTLQLEFVKRKNNQVYKQTYRFFFSYTALNTVFNIFFQFEMKTNTVFQKTYLSTKATFSSTCLYSTQILSKAF